jgi:ribosome biogenesis GTPase
VHTESSTHSALVDLGWDDDWQAALAETDDPSLEPGRISRIDRGAVTVLTASGPRRATSARGVALAVGDWVTITAEHGSDDLHAVVTVLPRRSVFRRIADGPGALAQLVAANIDTVLLVTAVDGHLSVRHLERYLALAWQSGAVPVVVITKTDLASPGQVSEWSQAIEAAAPGVAVHAISTRTASRSAGTTSAGAAIESLAPYLAAGRTVALLGLSGAGKSSLVNFLAGADLLATGEVRSDGQGRHTTSHRELVALPCGALIIDTPGMRALSVAGSADGVRQAFADVEELVSRCAFLDCSHTNERGCAVTAAIAAGDLGADRLALWREFADQEQPVDHQADRLEVVVGKRRKATAKAARAVLRRDTAAAQRAAVPAAEPSP